jgi:hypothetical protein
MRVCACPHVRMKRVIQFVRHTFVACYIKNDCKWRSHVNFALFPSLHTLEVVVAAEMPSMDYGHEDEKKSTLGNTDRFC